MSNDLISRRALIDAIKKWLPKYPRGKEQRLEDIIATDLSVSMLMEIEESPTAYDVDAVCEELEKRADESREYWQKYDDEQAFGEIEAYCESIMVVRNGGEKSENKNP